MRKFVWTFALALLVATPVLASEIWYAPQVTGKKERKYLRHFLYVNNLSGDKKGVYDEYGYTPHRTRTADAGRIREQWTYLEHGVSFVFDQCNELVETHTVSVEHRRSWAYQRDVRGYDENVPCDDCDH
jgi:hypothetical protein